ncbi:hypothetical protein SAMN05216270_11323 [Glycomyces harbinensis]|uniref:Uncharacterized protein n=1 Tax=Glycomyces harbinensis TaxID=58114 RepID=A0A1G7ACQ3_9ACTN|nr:hypothetical protein SAMN05216270_11323 [Glycomyces harbinensis]
MSMIAKRRHKAGKGLEQWFRPTAPAVRDRIETADR